MKTSQFGPEVVMLATIWLLIGCSAQPPTAISKRPPETPPLDEAFESHATQPQITEPIRDDTPVSHPVVTPTFDLISDQSTRRPARWHFALDDIIRYQTALIEVESLGGHDYRNERTVQFRWTVLEVDADGSATIHVAVDRIILNLERPSLQYDTDNGRPDIGTDADNTKQQELKAAWALLLANLTVETTAYGEVTALFGSKSITGAWKCLCLTTADFPVLPKEPVGLQDSWCVPLNGGSESEPNPIGKMNCRLSRDQPIGGRGLCVIECQTTMATTEEAQTPSGTASPIGSSSVGRFDRDIGLFLSRITNGTYSITADKGQQIQRSYQAKQQLFPLHDKDRPSLDVLVEKMFPPPKQVPLESAKSEPTSSAAEPEKASKMRRGPVER